MFTLSVVLGSSILYKDFSSATPARLLKFIFGCISTFIGVYLITSKRHLPRPAKPRPRNSIPHLRTSETPTETAPLLVVPSAEPTEVGVVRGLGETPPHLLGTSFGYHFTNPHILATRRATIPRRTPRDDIASAIWSRWRNGDDFEEGGPEAMSRSQSESLPACG